MGLLKDFAPQRVLKHLEDLLAIPHGSGHEAALGDHILALARRRSLPACRDGAGNILVRVPASPEGKGAPPVLVQGHMDMVLAQEPEVDRDLTVQPVELVLEGSVLRADRTTLGADNGVGLCTMMALMEADDLSHPPLELLFTVEEETGFTGILNFDMGQLKARRMIQMDCGDPDCLVMGAAGGAQYTLSRTCGICPGGAGLRVRVSGLRGGHSGLEMGKNRGSALDLCGRLLAALCQQMPVRLGLLTTPNQGSSIPQEAALSFLPPEGRREEAREICQSCFCQFHEELLETEPDFSASLEDCPLEETASEADTQALASFLLLLPYEALRRDTEHPAWVLCSALLTQAGYTGGRFFGKYAIRANLNSYRDAAALRFQQLCRLTGVEAEQTAPFLPAWPQRRDSPLRQVCLDAFARRFGRPMSIEVEHGTVEVGILVGAIPDMDAVGFAPKSRGAHTTREHLYLETVEPFWQLFCDVLERLCQE